MAENDFGVGTSVVRVMLAHTADVDEAQCFSTIEQDTPSLVVVAQSSGID